MTDTLTGRDLGIITDARALAALNDLDALLAEFGIADTGPDAYAAAYARALGRAQYLLGELAAIAERLAGEQC